MPHRTASCSVIASAFIATSTPSTTAAPEPIVVMRTGMPAPGTAAIFDRMFDPPAIDNEGRVVFQAILADGPGITFDNDFGLWMTGDGGLQLLARGGSAAPGTNGAVFRYFGGEPGIVALRDGQAAFVAGLVNGVGDAMTGNTIGVWAGTPGALELVLRSGDPAPGIPGAIVDDFQNPWLGADGSLAIAGALELGPGGVVGGTSRVVWAGLADGLQPAARTGDLAPGTPSVFDFLNVRGYGGIGSLGFAGEIDLINGVAFTEDAGGWVGGPGSLELLGREGDPSPILGGTYLNFGSLSINRNGVTTFAQNINTDAPGIDFTNNQSLWIGADGSFEIIARRGDPAAAIDNAPPHGDVRIQNVISEFITRSGQVVYLAQLAGDDVTPDDNRAIFQTYRVGGPRLTRMVARTGVPLAGTDTGQGPAEFQTFVEEPIANARGDVVFKARLRTGVGGITTDSDEGIWARVNQRQGIFPVVLEGQTIDLDPDPAVEDLRTVADFIPIVQGTGGDDGRPTQLNDSGVLALAVPFTDGSWAVLMFDLTEFPCNPADLADPRGQHDLADIEAFVTAFNAGDANADLTGDGLNDLADITIFVTAFTAGCPL